jgi:RNA polymerase-binding transcription factor DksA
MPLANQSLLRTLGQEEREVRQRIAALRRRQQRRFGIPEAPGERSLNVLEAALKTSAEQHEEVLRHRLAHRSQELAEALERVREGTYGMCQACGRRIPRRRLQALPTARLCVPCQELREVAHAA